MLASIATSSLSNAYYPEGNRGVGKTFSRVAMSIPFSMIDELVNEFGPDLEKKIVEKNEILRHGVNERNGDVSTASSVFAKTRGQGGDAGTLWLPGDLEKPVVALESCVQTEDVTDLKGGAVVHHKVATDNYVHVVWRRRRKHRFQLARAGLHLLLQARRQSSIHDQLAL